MGGLEQIRVKRGNYHYQEIIRLPQENQRKSQVAYGGSLKVTVPTESVDEWLRLVEIASSVNEVTLDERGGILQCVFTGLMLYPINGADLLGEVDVSHLAFELDVFGQLAIPYR